MSQRHLLPAPARQSREDAPDSLGDAADEDAPVPAGLLVARQRVLPRAGTRLVEVAGLV